MYWPGFLYLMYHVLPMLLRFPCHDRHAPLTVQRKGNSTVAEEDANVICVCVNAKAKASIGFPSGFVV